MIKVVNEQEGIDLRGRRLQSIQDHLTGAKVYVGMKDFDSAISSCKEAIRMLEYEKKESVSESNNSTEDYSHIKGRYGKVKVYPSNLPHGDTIVYVGYHLSTSTNNEGVQGYVPVFNGERPLSMWYPSVEAAVKGLDKYIQNLQKQGKMLYLKPVNESVDQYQFTLPFSDDEDLEYQRKVAKQLGLDFEFVDESPEYMVFRGSKELLTKYCDTYGQNSKDIERIVSESYDDLNSVIKDSTNLKSGSPEYYLKLAKEIIDHCCKGEVAIKRVYDQGGISYGVYFDSKFSSKIKKYATDNLDFFKLDGVVDGSRQLYVRGSDNIFTALSISDGIFIIGCGPFLQYFRSINKTKE